jgi:hypothetical protein
MTSQLYQTSFYALFFAVLLCNVGGFQYSVMRENRVKLSKMSNHFAVKSEVYDSSSTLEDIKNDVEKYIAVRNAAIAAEVNATSSFDYENFVNPLEMFKPTGWYKDEVTLELQSRSDKTIPKVLHPLAFAELQRFGFDNLSTPIMSLGGPHEVGSKLGVIWVEPVVEKTIYDEEKKIAMTTTYLLDTRGSLKLGGASNEMIETAAAELDLNALKKVIKQREDGSLFGTEASRVADSFERDADGQIDYTASKAPLKKKSSYVLTESKTPKSERFSLNGGQRFYMSVTCLTAAFAHGRATQELLISGTNSFGLDLSTLPKFVALSTVISNVLILLAIASSSYSFKTAGLKNRNALVWTVKGLLGGPTTARQLRDLEILEKLEETNTNPK